MTLIRWDPLREVGSLQKEMNHLFDTLTPGRYHDWMNGTLMPRAELNETDDAIDLKVELPGMDPDDIDVQVTVDSISISGDRKSETRTEENGVVHSEFHYGKFQRVLPLPSRVDNTDVAAEYKDGILTLHLPKAPEERNKVVKVKLGS